MTLMHVVVISDNKEPLVTGFFRDEEAAAVAAYEFLNDSPFISGEFRTASDWLAQQEGVWVTGFVAAHAPTGIAGRQAA